MDGPPPPPPPEQRRRAGEPAPDRPDRPGRRRRWLAGAGFLAVLVAVVAGAALLADTVGDTADQLSQATDDSMDGSGGDGGAVDGGTGRDTAIEALHEVLIDIDASERAMIAFQIAAFRAEGDPETSEPRSDEAVRQDIVDAAETALDELRGIRDELADELPEDAGVAQTVRDSYVVHLDAWIDHIDEVADNPDLARGEPPEGTFEDINATAEDFADELAGSLPEDAPAEVRDLATLILERGFSDGGEDGSPPRDAV